MTVLTGVFLLQQRQFDSTTLLRSLTYSVALSIRQAQTYGTSVRAFNNVFASAHGIYLCSGGAQCQQNYYLFADADNDRARAVDGSEDVETFSLTGQNFTISRFCATTSGGTITTRCSDTNEITSLTILFIRPNPDACIETSNSAAACVVGSAGEDYSNATIQLQGPGGATRSVTITNTGQISVGATGT